MAAPEELIARVNEAGEAYARFIERQSDAAFHRRPTPEEWAAAELTGHVAEFPATFAAQARRLASSPGLKLGRSLDDPGRLAAVEKLAGAGPVEAADSVRATIRQAIEELRAIPPDAWQVAGEHSRLGRLTVAEVVQEFIVDHIQTHLAQARATVGA